MSTIADRLREWGARARNDGPGVEVFRDTLTEGADAIERCEALLAEAEIAVPDDSPVTRDLRRRIRSELARLKGGA